MTAQAERIDLDSPLDGDFQAVVRLIIGGIAERVDFAFEEIDDLQLAVERLLAESGEQGSVHLSFEVAEDTIRARVGPLREGAIADALRDGDPARPGQLTLKRILETVVDSFARRALGRRPRGGAAREAEGLGVNAVPRRSDVPERAREEDRELLRRYHDGGDTSAREELIQRHLPLVRSLARRYAGRGESLEDIEQVGAIGLIKAIDRFELERDVSLATYATPNVVGEIKRHFRDKGWAIRVPRALQELNASMSGAIERLTGRLGRSPSIGEIAEELKTTPEEVLEAMEVGSAYSTVSLSSGPGRRGARPARDDRRRGRRVRALRAPGGAGAGARSPRSARARDPADALRGGAAPDADRPAGGPVADARLAADPQVAHGHARRAAGRAAGALSADCARFSLPARGVDSSGGYDRLRNDCLRGN